MKFDRQLKRKRKRQAGPTGEYVKWLKKNDPRVGRAHETFVLAATTARKIAGLTEAQLADMVGTTEQKIIDFEAGNAPPESAKVYERMKDVLMIRFLKEGESPPEPGRGMVFEFRF